jgi:hypothetical protein
VLRRLTPRVRRGRVRAAGRAVKIAGKGGAMRERFGRWMGCGIAAAICASLIVVAWAAGAAEAKTGSAEIKAVSGQVEIQKKGESQWVPATIGTKLFEGDNIRAFGGASARMDLPDGSTIFLAENSRVVVGKLEFDQQNQAREALFHLAVGKVRAVVSQTALRLVKARQSNFSISTQTAVAAVRGTDFEVTYDEAQKVMRIAVLPESGPAPKGDGS